MCIMTKSLIELDELLMHHGMLSQVCDELLLLSCCRKFAMQESITTVCKVTLLCQLINVVPGIDCSLNCMLLVKRIGNVHLIAA